MKQTKMHGIPDKTLMSALVGQDRVLHQHKLVINHLGKMLLWTIALAVVEAGALIYILLWRMQW